MAMKMADCDKTWTSTIGKLNTTNAMKEASSHPMVRTDTTYAGADHYSKYYPRTTRIMVCPSTKSSEISKTETANNSTYDVDWAGCSHAPTNLPRKKNGPAGNARMKT